MRMAKAFFLTTVLAVGALEVRDASACGGCFAPANETESTQITGEKMLLSLSQQQTTLYDEITYSGSPSSFAWVLPIKGLATVGLSSDALFQNLGIDTQVTISSPPLPTCNPGGCQGGDAFGTSGSSGAGGSSSGGPVTVISQAVVGPYQTVQLMSTDPAALTDWLTMNGYNISAADAPVVAAYINEGFNFLALKLVPGAGVSSMRPVRVTTQGASPVLPLRMVAVGTGVITPVTLWVLAEGRYDTVNLPSFQIDPGQLIWDWDTQSSNYAQLKLAAFAQTNNTGWLIEDAEPFSMFTLQEQLSELVASDPVSSGYADPMGMGADQALSDDMTTLFAGIDPSSTWITRFEGQLSRAALANDLQIAAASDQSIVQRQLTVTLTTGSEPTCPPPAPCEGGEGGFGGSTGAGWSFWGNGTGGGTTSGGCTTNGHDSSSALFGTAAVMAALAFARRRRVAVRVRG
jgi:hypothetical protein